MPTITARAAALHQRMQQAKDVKPRQRVQALSVLVSGHARPRPELAALVGGHRHSVAAWLEAYAAGGVEQALRYQGPRPPSRQRSTPPALVALQERRQDPPGCAGYAPLRTWVAAQHQGHWSYAGG